jgi:uncharacterized protein YbjT (DUF2867 family)
MSSERQTMILVTGATGIAGSEVVRALIGRGQAVRVLARDPVRARDLFGPAVEVVSGDFDDALSVRAALVGAEQLVLSCADDPRRVAWETGAIDAAVASGVRRIVKLSAIGAEPGSPVAFWDWHGRVERQLEESGIAAVVLRSSFYMSNVAAQIGFDGRLYAPAGGARIAMIDPGDVGAAAAAVLTTSGYAGRTYVITGPAAITYAQVATELSAVTGRDVAFVDVDDDDARRQLGAGGVPEAIAGEVVRLFGALRAGAAERVTAEVESLTGRAARDFAAFARDHACAFAPAAVAAAR